jgi:hypothetical protein
VARANALYEGGTGFADLRPFKAPAAFIGQSTRTTPPLHRFNDTLNFAVYHAPEVGAYHSGEASAGGQLAG